MVELKPCPFCGGYPQPTRVGDNKQYIVYRCEDCKRTPVQYYEANLNIVWAANVWNRAVENQPEQVCSLNREASTSRCRCTFKLWSVIQTRVAKAKSDAKKQ